MNDVLELINEVRQTGATLRADPPDLVISPPGRVPPDLKERLKENKTEILRRLELEESMRRLEAAHVSIAVFEDGSMRVIESEEGAKQARVEGGTVYSPEDMLHYIRLDQRGRRVLHTVKRRFGGTTEWIMDVAQQ